MQKITLILLILLFPLCSFSQLSAGVDVTINPGVPVTLTATYGMEGIPVNFLDENGVEPRDLTGFPIGFNFSFFGTSYSNFWIGANGWISFSPNTTSHDWSKAFTVPNSTSISDIPTNCIFGPFVDLDPTLPGAPFVFYRTIGQSPNQSLIVMWCNCPMFECPDVTATFQIILHEGDDIIDDQIMIKPKCAIYSYSNSITLGVQHMKNGINVGKGIQNYNPADWNGAQMAWEYTYDPAVENYNYSSPTYNLMPLTPGDKIIYNWYEQWSTGDTWIGEGKSIVVTPIETTNYRVEAQVCSGDQFNSLVTVNVHPIIPTAFNPDSKIEENKKFKILGIPSENITEFNLQIFDRWGQVVFETTDITEGWDGTYKGQPCPSEVYNWIIFYQTSKKTRVSNKGQVTVIR
ncbi:MAG: gliding motility-associated C-terminal domain-containing protein [Bacteroidetes bacterium]|nr:gliding motility-associated C-terminal domain-containing protein [Bacteroidota bacterium]